MKPLQGEYYCDYRPIKSVGKSVQNVFILNEIDTKQMTKQMAILNHCIDNDGLRNLKIRSLTEDSGAKDMQSATVNIDLWYFLQTINLFERFKPRQKHGERIQIFVFFTNSEENVLWDHFVFGLQNEDQLKKLLGTKNLTLEKCVDI